MKKQKLKNYLKLGILLFGISLMLINCQADEPTFDADKQINAKTVSFEQAKAFFESKKGTGNSSFQNRSSSDGLILDPNWNSLSQSDMAYTNAQLTKANTTVNRTGDFSSKLLFVNIDNEIQSVILTTWVTDYSSNNNIVNATIYLNGYDGSFLDAYKIENGLFSHRLVPGPNVQTAGFFMFLQDLIDDPCWNTDILTEGENVIKVDLGTVSGGGDSGANSGGFTSGIDLGSGSYWGYMNGGIDSAGGFEDINPTGAGGGITSGGIDIGAGIALTNPPDKDCLGGKVKIDGVCECPTGKIENTTTGHCECPEGKVENELGNCVEEESLTNCNQLKKLSNTDEFSANINPIVTELRSKTGLSNEFAINFRKNFNNDGEEYNFQDSNGIEEGKSKTESGAKIGTVWFGSIHTHPVGTYPMFSWADVNRLRDVYQGLHTDFTKEDVFIMIVNHDGTVYAIKIDDIAILINKLDAELLNTDGTTEKDKERNLNKIMQKKYKKDSNNERAFLKKFNDYGVELYKANDQNLSNWSRLELDDPTATNPNVNPIPCN